MGLQDVLEAEGAKGRPDSFLGRHVLSPRLAAEDREDTAGGKCNTDDTLPQSQAGLCPSDAALKDMCWAWHHSQSALGDGSTQLQSSGQPGGHPCGSSQAGPRPHSWNSVPILPIPWLSSGHSHRDHQPDSCGFLCLAQALGAAPSWICLFPSSCLTL